MKTGDTRTHTARIARLGPDRSATPDPMRQKAISLRTDATVLESSFDLLFSRAAGRGPGARAPRAAAALRYSALGSSSSAQPLMQ